MYLDEMVGKVISERPYVRLLSQPSGQLPLMDIPVQMLCLAQVEDTVSIIEVTITRQYYDKDCSESKSVLKSGR